MRRVAGGAGLALAAIATVLSLSATIGEPHHPPIPLAEQSLPTLSAAQVHFDPTPAPTEAPTVEPTPEPTIVSPVVPWVTATPVPLTTVAPVRSNPPAAGGLAVVATYYHPSLQGGVMMCGGTYDQWDPTVVATAVANDWRWPCGTTFRISGPAGSIVAVRQDGCGGCGANHVDLSTAANLAVCGGPSTCTASLEVIR